MARFRRTDDQTAERLLSGQLDPQDAPPALSGVASLFASAAVPADPADPDEALLTAMSVAALSAEPLNRRKPMLSKSRSAKIGAIAFGGVLLMGGTAAAANSGALPDVAQDVAHDVAGAVGVDVPDSNGLSDEVHDIVESTDPGRERGEKISKAAHDRNEARKAAREDAEVEDDEGSTTEGKSADAHEANEDRKADREADTEDDAASVENEGGEPAEQANENATDGGEQNAADGADNATTPSLPEQAEAGVEHRSE